MAKTKAIGWTAFITKSGVDFLITVHTKTRKEAIAEIERLTNIPVAMPREVKRCAVMPEADAPKDMRVYRWSKDPRNLSQNSSTTADRS